jgi:hypothetical protein
VTAASADAIRETGALRAARWSKYQEIIPENRIAAGRDLFKFLCGACHTRDMEDEVHHPNSLGMFRNVW